MLKICKNNFTSHIIKNSNRIMMAIIEGNEEIETVTISNILTRAGNEVKICKVNIDEGVMESSKIADLHIEYEDHYNYDIVIMPGGIKGAENYSKSSKLKQIIGERIKDNMLYGAICATPALFLAPNKFLLSKATCYPTLSKTIIENGYEFQNVSCLIDNYCITGRGPGDAMNYALNIVKILNGEEKLKEIKKSLVLF